MLLEELGRVLDECLSKGGVVVAVLPTGYGKTSFVRNYLMERVVRGELRVVHVLPLRAIVRDAAKKAVEAAERVVRGGGEAVGYQAGVVVEDVEKAPYLAKHYMVVTVDSLLLSFYGIPVYEMMRLQWHSDAAYALARSFDLAILDEYHLMITGDADVEEEKGIDLLAKQVESLARFTASYVKAGRCVAVFTATLPPSLLAVLLKRVSELTGVKPRVWLVGFGNEKSRYYELLSKYLKSFAEVATIYIKVDEGFEACSPMRTYIVKTPVVEASLVKSVPDLDRVVKVLQQDMGELGGLSVFIAFNSWRRAFAAYERYKQLFERVFACKAYLLTGKMASYDRDAVLKKLSGEEPICLFATQVVEAGVDVSFDLLITEAAPLPALAQRAGRVSRYSRPGSRNAIVILVDEEGCVDSFVKGVYDPEMAEKTIELLEGCLEPAPFGWVGSFEWRCVSPEGCDLQHLLARLDEDVNLYARLERALQGVVGVEDTLVKLLAFTRPPFQVIQELDEKLKGSFVRKSALIPLVPGEVVEELKDVELDADKAAKLLESVVVVDQQFVKKHGEKLLEVRDGRISAVFLVEERGRYRISIVQDVALQDLVGKPLYTMWSMSRRYSGREHTWRFVGFLLKRGSYVESLGLKPV